MTTPITAAELRKRMASKNDICLLDVRRRTDYEQSPETIGGATWHDPDEVAEWARTLPEDKEIVVYCVRGGSVSQSTATALQESHPNVRFLEGGILGWQGAGK